MVVAGALALEPAPARAQTTGAAVLPAAAAPRAARADTALAAADTLLAAGRVDEAMARYAAVVARDSAASSRAVLRLAHYHATRDSLATAVTLYALHARLEPDDVDGRVAYARTLAWTGRHEAAVAEYDRALADLGRYRELVLGRALVLAWWGRYDASVAAYERWLRFWPDDAEAELELARVLSWADRFDDAERRYAHADRGATAARAQRGLAQLAAWRGDLPASERRWRALVGRDSADAESWIGLAEVLRWSGRPGAAAQAVSRAVALAPASTAARTQRRWVRAELAPFAEPHVVYGNDSDRNRSVSYSTTGSVAAPWDGRLVLTASMRQASLGVTEGTALSARVMTSWAAPHGGVTVRAELGASRQRATMGAASVERTAPSGGVRVAASPTRALVVGAGVSRLPFDETATLIANGIVTTAAEADYALALPAGLALSGGVGHAWISNGSGPNRRLAASSGLRWTVRRGLALRVGARTFGYATDTLFDGYFSPRRFTLVEAGPQLAWGRDLGWSASADLGLGAQGIRARGASAWRLAERGTVGAGYRFTPGTELGMAATLANVAAPQTVSAAEYRAYSLQLRARIRI